MAREIEAQTSKIKEQTDENIRKNEGNQRKIDKKIRDRDPYFLFKIVLVSIVTV